MDKIRKNKLHRYIVIAVCAVLLAVIITVTLVLVLCCITFSDRIFPDGSTASYWINELMLFCNGMTTAFIIPVMLFELLCCYLGLKNVDEKK